MRRNKERLKQKKKNEALNRRKKTLIKKAFKLGEFNNIDVALIIRKHGRYITYRSTARMTWPPSMADIVSDCLDDQKQILIVRLANFLSAPTTHFTGRYQKGPSCGKIW
jgi:hypothetical protein